MPETEQEQNIAQESMENTPTESEQVITEEQAEEAPEDEPHKTEEDEKAKQAEQEEREKRIKAKKAEILQRMVNDLFEEFRKMQPQALDSLARTGLNQEGQQFPFANIGTMSPESTKSLVQAFREGLSTAPDILVHMPNFLQHIDKILTEEAERLIDEEDKEKEAGSEEESEENVAEEETAEKVTDEMPEAQETPTIEAPPEQ
jgi:hypothetical protein